VDLATVTELGLDRNHRQAVADPGAAAAPLAHRLVDDDSLRRLVELAPLAQPARLRGAPLVVDEHRDARVAPELLLDGDDVLAGPNLHAGGEVGRTPVPPHVVGDDRDRRDALGGQRPGEGGHVHEPGDVLAAGHRHGGVVEQLERDVDAGGDAGPDGEAARVAEGAVAQVLEDVPPAGEGREPDPVHALRSHGSGRDELLGRVPVLEVDHAVAAHAAAGDRPLRYDGRAVVRAAAAERRGARRQVEQGQERAPTAGPRRRGRGRRVGGRRVTGEVGPQPMENIDETLGSQLTGDGHERRAVGAALAPHRRRAPRLVEERPDLLLHERPLVLDDEDLVTAAGQRPDRRGDDGGGEGQLQDADARGGEIVGPDATGPEHVAVGPARAHDAEPGVGRGADEPVEPAGLNPRLGRSQALVEPQRLELRAQDRSRRPVVPGLAVDDDRRVGRREAPRVGVDGADAVGDGGDDPDADPRPARPAQPEGFDGEVEQVLLVGGHEHRDAGVGQRGVRVVRQRRRLRRRVVADEQQRATVGAGAHAVGVLENVAAPVEPRSLPVPGAHDPVDADVGNRLATSASPTRLRRRAPR
jgi:hypothetical protein